MSTDLVLTQSMFYFLLGYCTEGGREITNLSLMNGVKLSSLARILFFIVFRTDGEKWSRLRKALASKMLRPKDIRENLDNFNSVTRDAIDRIVAIRGEDDVIPDLEGELAKYATECKLIFCPFQLHE